MYKYNHLRDNKQEYAIFFCELGKGSTFPAGHLLAILGVELPNVDHDVALPVPHRHLPPIRELAAPQTPKKNPHITLRRGKWRNRNGRETGRQTSHTVIESASSDLEEGRLEERPPPPPPESASSPSAFRFPHFPISVGRKTKGRERRVSKRRVGEKAEGEGRGSSKE